MSSLVDRREILTGRKTRMGKDPWHEILCILDEYEAGVQPRTFRSLEEGGHENEI